MQGAAGTGGAGASQDPPLLRMSDGPGLDTETLPPGEPDPYACFPPAPATAVVLAPPDWAFQVTGCDRQAVSDAFLVDPDLRDMDKFDDKVERLQRIMKAKRELAKACLRRRSKTSWRSYRTPTGSRTAGAGARRPTS